MKYAALKISWLYLRYWLKAENSKGHGVHSPFVYKLITEVLTDSRNFYAFGLIEARRAALLADENDELYPSKYGTLLFRLVNYFGVKNIVELGTSHGITGCYLAAANSFASLVTIEASPQKIDIAKQSFEAVHLDNIKVVEGKLADILLPTIRSLEEIDFVCINSGDADWDILQSFHQLLPFINDKTVVIINNIYISSEMRKKWLEIIEHPSVRLSIDLFFLGIVFFRKEQAEKEHFMIRY